MRRRRYGLTEQKILRFLREGRGLGTGPTYNPWFNVSDVPSRGRSHRVYWWKTDRVHHLLSDIEFFIFIHLAWSEVVVDIREQFPLPRRDTVSIAKALRIRHPIDPHAKAVWVITTDLLATLADGDDYRFIAIAAKTEKDLDKPSVIKKLEIERRYWEARNVPWFLVTDTQVKTSVGRSLRWIFDGSEKPWSITETDRTVLSLLAEKKQTHSWVPIKRVCAAIDNDLYKTVGTALASLRRLLAWKMVTVDLDAPYLQDLPLSDFSFGGQKIGESRVCNVDLW